MLTPDYLLRLVVCSAVAGLAIGVSRRIAMRLTSNWYTPQEESAHLGILLGVMAGFGVVRDYSHALTLIGLTVVLRVVHKWRQGDAPGRERNGTGHDVR